MSIETMKQWLKALEHSHANEPIWKTPHKEAITSLRQAIANEALNRMAENARELGLDYEPVQAEKAEPVAWMYDWTTSDGEFIQDWTTSEAETLRDTEPTIISNVRPLYLHPAKWQSLTLQEHYDLADKAGCMSTDWIDYARAIEKALKEKNSQ